MFKSIIAPVQAWLLSQGRCDGCGMYLREEKMRRQKNGIKRIFCRCGRVFVYNQKTKKYHRIPLRTGLYRKRRKFREPSVRSKPLVAIGG